MDLPFYLILVLSICFTFVFSINDEVYLKENTLYSCCRYTSDYPNIYCYSGKEKHIIYLWETVQLHLNLSSEDFKQFDGSSPQEVINQYENQRNSWNFNFYNANKNVIKLNPFNDTCVGIVTKKDYVVKLIRIRVDYWRVLIFLSGLLLFFTASKLSGNSLFYYICGTSVGTFASILILIFILSRMIPKKPAMYAFLAGGWTVGIYIVQRLWDNLRTVALDYNTYIFYYIGTTSIISFVICYRMGPVSDPRSVDLITWALQGFGLILILLSSDFREATLSFIILLLSGYCLPFGNTFRFIYKLFKSWSYPEKRRLLTDDEYHEQGVIETRKALDSLRGYCSSPECNQWRTVLRLKEPLSKKSDDKKKSKGNVVYRYSRYNTTSGDNGSVKNRSLPQKMNPKVCVGFAKFVEGSSHLADEEVLAFETDTKQQELHDLLTDDSDTESSSD